MATLQTEVGWKFAVQRGPDWVFVRLLPDYDSGDGAATHDVAELADGLWSLLKQSFTYRLVLELDAVGILHSQLIAQLVLLAKRVHGHGGLLRLCGLSPENQQVIHLCRLDGCLQNFGNRGDAVMGHRPMQPR